MFKIVWLINQLAVSLQPTLQFLYKRINDISRSRAAVARRAHNPKVGSSILPFATKKALHFMRGFSILYNSLGSYPSEVEMFLLNQDFLEILLAPEVLISLIKADPL